jgi:carbon-monoxide dehydrogenase medium subunit
MTYTQYERPATVAQAVGLLSREPGRVALLAGGTDLMIKMRAGSLDPDLLVDIKHIPDLTRIQWAPDGELRLGGAVTIRHLYEDEKIGQRFRALSEGAWAIGSIQIRQRATVGGNLCNASPCMDTAPGLLLLRARIVAVSKGGTREIPLIDFFINVKKTALFPDELATEIIVPAQPAGLLTAFDKIKRVRGHDLALVNAAGAFDPEAKTLVVAIGSCGTTTLVSEPLTGVEAGKDVEATAAKLADLATKRICPIDDVRASAEYRRDMTALLCRRLTRRLLAGGCACCSGRVA